MGKNSTLTSGYKAPRRLEAPSLEKFRGGLDDLAEKARQESEASKSIQKGVSVMSQTGLPSTYCEAYASFKSGTKRPRPEGAGGGWFGMRSTPMTENMKKDLALLRNRNYLDPKRFYKSSDTTSSILQAGTVIEGAAEFYSARLVKKQRRGNLVDEILADPTLSDYATNKYKNMQREQTAKKLKRRKGGKKKK